MKYTIRPSTKFQKDLKKAKKRGCNIEELKKVINTLANGEKLDKKYKDHFLTGDYKGKRECHINPDWLLIYEQDDNDLYLYLVRTGTHSDLF